MKAIAVDDEPLALHVIETFCTNIECVQLQKTFTKPSEALKHLRKFPADLIFLDINMPAISGINFIKELQQNVMVIFTTAYSEYAVMSYELNAIDYLLKPISQKRFEQAVLKANDYYNFVHQAGKAVQKDIFIRADFRLVKVALDEILYIEGLGDYLKIYIKDRKTVVARMTMKEISASLPVSEFIRVHRSFILPKNRIQSVRNKTIIIPEKEIPIGNTYLKQFFEQFQG